MVLSVVSSSYGNLTMVLIDSQLCCHNWILSIDIQQNALNTPMVIIDSEKACLACIGQCNKTENWEILHQLNHFSRLNITSKHNMDVEI